MKYENVYTAVLEKIRVKMLVYRELNPWIVTILEQLIAKIGFPELSNWNVNVCHYFGAQR